jgi:hypothetical protein
MRITTRLSRIGIVTTLASALVATGCAYHPTFGFPIEQGDIEAGRQAFIENRCHQCHTVAGVRLPELGVAPPLFELGGEISNVKAYSELVTSIINPDHEIAERYREERRRRGLPALPMPMPHIESMTVRQLIDLVAFLDSRYVLIDDYESQF